MQHFFWAMFPVCIEVKNLTFGMDSRISTPCPNCSNLSLKNLLQTRLNLVLNSIARGLLLPT
jgi:hypothetical protein